MYSTVARSFSGLCTRAFSSLSRVVRLRWVRYAQLACWQQMWQQRRQRNYFSRGFPFRKSRKHLNAVTVLSSLAKQVGRLPIKPPLTLALVAVMCALHFCPVFVPDLEFISHALVTALCVRPSLMRYGGEWCAFLAPLHADEVHLFYNMSSFLSKGMMFETRLGTERYGALLLFLVLGSAAIHVALAALLAGAFPELFLGELHSCAIGFSSVIFALKAMLHTAAPSGAAGRITVFGFHIASLPLRLVSWVELLAIQLVYPSASWLGHASGIIAGLLAAAVS